MRVDGKVQRGYRRAHLEDAFARYIPSTTKDAEEVEV
jgi:hypothetical protein